jgi:hypothetical protein
MQKTKLILLAILIAIPFIAQSSNDNSLQAALAAKGSNYKPRTEHLLSNGQPKFTNRLILQNSPYLLQHAHNLVNWYAWGDEAFAKARQENKPIFLFISPCKRI